MADDRHKPDAAQRKGHKNGYIENHEENEYSEEEEPNFSDPEDFEDDISDEELLDDLLEKRPSEKDGIDSVIIVDNVPMVQNDNERFSKLQNVIRKIFSSFGKIVNEYYPANDNGQTKGYIFIEYSSPAHASEATKKADRYKLDKSHTLLVNLFSDFDKYSSLKVYEDPQPQPYKELGNLRHWIQDEDASDQYAVISDEGAKTSIFKHRSVSAKQLEERTGWTDTVIRWSPMGTYLATFHAKGVALWGGSEFTQIMRFLHPGVQVLDFSPCERYLVTFCSEMERREDQQSIIIWDILTGQKKRGFHCENRGTWPILKWSYNGQYFARIGTDCISIYEVPSFGLLDKKSLKVDGVKEFCWSPADNYIAYWVPEHENVPCRVTLVEIPSRKDACAKNLFNVADCKMHWQKNGDFMCVKVDRYSKAKKVEEKEEKKYSGIYYNFELFRIREKQIPIDKVECRENVIAFAWEPNGTKFAFLHGESPRISLSFYAMKPDKVELLKTFERRVANMLFWSPNGQFIVAAGLRNMNGSLEFIDTSDMTVMSQSEHFMATDIEWDPSGRYVVTSVSWWGHKVDNAYWIHNFQGRTLQKQAVERFCLVSWRPRPPSLLQPSHLQDVKKNFKKYAQQFEIKDKISQSTASKEIIDRRKQLMDEYTKYRKMKRQQHENENYKKLRLEQRGGIDTDELDSHVENFEEETVEFLVEIKETIIEKEKE